MQFTIIFKFDIYRENISVLYLSDSYAECQATANWLLSRTEVCPIVAIVCGSGLGGLAEILKDPQVFSYSEIPNFPQSTGVLIISVWENSCWYAHLRHQINICVCVCIGGVHTRVCAGVFVFSAWPRWHAGVWNT